MSDGHAIPPAADDVEKAPTPAASPAGLRDYVDLARPDHWIKHGFIVPGIALAWILHDAPGPGWPLRIVLGFASACLIASANYVINEWLDADFDAHHPIKKHRPAVSKRLKKGVVLAEYFLLSAAGLLLAGLVSPLFLGTSIAFFASGLIYNVPPVRTKDVAFLDVASEALNNPIRLILGWAMIDSSTLPPSSLLLAYWFGGAFLMAIKRYSEYRFVVATAGQDQLMAYRASFRTYTENSLLTTSFVYALMAAFFVAVFLIKYRIEYLLSLPFFAALFGTYFQLGMREVSPAQTPEKLFREKGLMLLLVALVAVLAALTWIDIPWLEGLTDPHYIQL